MGLSINPELWGVGRRHVLFFLACLGVSFINMHGGLLSILFDAEHCGVSVVDLKFYLPYYYI